MDEINWLRFVLSFVFVLGLIGLCALGLRKWGGRLMIASPVMRGPARLQVVETCYLAPRQRLMLVRRDGLEHLLLISGETTQVIEQGITHEE